MGFIKIFWEKMAGYNQQQARVGATLNTCERGWMAVQEVCSKLSPRMKWVLACPKLILTSWPIVFVFFFALNAIVVFGPEEHHILLARLEPTPSNDFSTFSHFLLHCACPMSNHVMHVAWPTIMVTIITWRNRSSKMMMMISVVFSWGFRFYANNWFSVRVLMPAVLLRR